MSIFVLEQLLLQQELIGGDCKSFLDKRYFQDIRVELLMERQYAILLHFYVSFFFSMFFLYQEKQTYHTSISGKTTTRKSAIACKCVFDGSAGRSVAVNCRINP